MLEDRGATAETFIELQEKAKAEVYTAEDSIMKFHGFLKKHRLGLGYYLPFILEELSKYDLDLNAKDNHQPINNPFLDRLLRYAMNHVLRQMKHGARIPVPNGYLLPGIADEGQVYINEGHDPGSVFTLDKGMIYGTCLCSRFELLY